MPEAFDTAWLNGDYLPLAEARISPLDRGFLLGDSIYEVIPVYDGEPFRLDAHLDRMAYSLGEIRLANPHSEAEWREIVLTLIERNGGGDQGVYCQVTRGTDRQRDHAFPARAIPATCFAMSMALHRPPARLMEEGARLTLVEDIRWHRCDIKTTGLLANVLARQAAREAEADEALFHRDGKLTEGSSMTLFLVEDGRIYTPAKSNAILPGITRDAVIDLARELGVPVVEGPIPVARLHAADEVWMTSSMREIMPVTRVDGNEAPITIGSGRPGPLWARLQAALETATGRSRKPVAS